MQKKKIMKMLLHTKNIYLDVYRVIVFMFNLFYFQLIFLTFSKQTKKLDELFMSVYCKQFLLLFIYLKLNFFRIIY